MMENDINTLGYNQWYAFSVNNTSEEVKTIDLKIVNFVKIYFMKTGKKQLIIQEGNEAVVHQRRQLCMETD